MAVEAGPGNHVGSAATAFQITNQHGPIVVREARPPGRVAVPSQVPAFTGVFVNRQGPLAELDQLAADRTPIIVLYGVRGSGKSTLGRHWFGLVRNRYPGGQLHVDLSMADDTVETAIVRCLAEMGVDVDVPRGGLQYRCGQFRSVTADVPMAVFIEGATEPAQVRALIPNAPGSVAVVTAAGPLDELGPQGARFITLDSFTAAHSWELLATLCGAAALDADPAATATVIEACDGLPQLLCVMAVRLARREVTVTELAAQITREGTVSVPADGSLTAGALTSAYEGLPAQAALVFRRCALLPGPDFTSDVAALVSDPPPEQIGALLVDLVEYGLLSRTDDLRYRMPSLIRDHARRMADRDDDARICVARLHAVARRYRDVAGWADLAVMGNRRRWSGYGSWSADENPFQRADALTWFSDNETVLLAAQQMAVEHGWDVEAAELGEAMSALYLHWRSLPGWIKSGLTGADAAARCGLPALETRLRSFTSRPLVDAARLAEAGEQLDRARTLAEPLDDPVLLASVLEMTGRYLDVTDPPQAVRVYRRALDLNTTAGEARGAALVRYFLGCALWKVDEREAALAAIDTAHRELEQLGDVRMAGRVLGSWATMLADSDRIDEAIALLERAIELLTGRGPYYEARAREELARLLVPADRARAVEQLRRALELQERVGGPTVQRLRDTLATLTAE